MEIIFVIFGIIILFYWLLSNFKTPSKPSISPMAEKIAASYEHRGDANAFKGVWALDKEENYKAAIYFFEQALREGFEKHKLEEICVLLSTAYKRLNRLDDAIRVLNKSIKENPNSFESWYKLYNIYVETDRPNEAEGCLIRALNAEPNNLNPASYVAKGYFYMKKDDPKNALGAFEKALNIDSKYAEAYAGKALALVELNKPIDADISLSKAVELGYKDFSFLREKIDKIKADKS